MLAVGSLLTTVAYQATLRQIRGAALFSDAIYTLAADLPEAPAVVLLDWGFGHNLEFITQK